MKKKEGLPALKKKVHRKIDYSRQKEYSQHKHQQSENNQKTKMERKTTVLIFQVTTK